MIGFYTGFRLYSIPLKPVIISNDEVALKGGSALIPSAAKAFVSPG